MVLLPQVVPERWRRLSLQVGKEGENADPASWLLSALLRAPSFRSSPPLALPVRVKSIVLKPGGTSAPLTRGQVWGHCSCKPSPQGSPDGKTGGCRRWSVLQFQPNPTARTSQISAKPSPTASPEDRRFPSPLQHLTSVRKRDRIQETVLFFNLSIVATQYFTSCNSSQGTI